MDQIRTSDIGLVAFLKIEGHEVVDITWDDGTCYWIVQGSSLAESLEAFRDHTARVEPTRYNAVYGETKREFYDSKPLASVQ